MDSLARGEGEKVVWMNTHQKILVKEGILVTSLLRQNNTQN